MRRADQATRQNWSGKELGDIEPDKSYAMQAQEKIGRILI